MITNQSIQQIKELPVTDIVEKAGVRLKKRGAKFEACCPLHNEKSPSFYVSNVKGIFKCFGCGAGGDGIKFIEMYERLDFMGAVERIAQLFNITLDYDTSIDKEQLAAQREVKKTQRQLLTEAHKLYCTLLYSDKGTKALEYLYSRGYTDDIINTWNLGYAPDEWRLLADSYSRDGLIPAALKVGLIKENEDKRCYDVYRNRIIFPILDHQGELVTFGGRVLEEKAPNKYINGSASELYDKSKTLIGLYQAQAGIRKHGFAILVEGYTDVISMHTAGADNTVASCGTALTDEQCRLLRKYTAPAHHIIIMRDADTAGIKATSKDLQLLVKHGFKVDILSLPEKQDPDNFAKPFFNLIKSEADATGAHV